MDNSRILVISDLHAPYMHRDVVPFLTALKKKYRPTRIILTGDEADKHALSFHEHDPDLSTSGDELEKAIKQLEPLYKLFPVADILESNHGSLSIRRAVHYGLSRKYIKAYGEVLHAPKGWRWHELLRLDVAKRKIVFAHGLSANAIQVVKSMGACFVQGHFHTKYNIDYVTSFDGQQFWGMTVGCLIDDSSLAFRYNKLQLSRPMLGVGTITNGDPHLVPMVLDSHGRWTGNLP
jgi:predicted phosphodiesterase